ncbi:MAG: [protein-PII] uridylyltransferase, partial [Myxococcales bacterium]|nr:[protein-PII] uridylyltransferase [Myxococcales bacterium]
MSKALGAAPSPTLKPDRLAPLKLMLETERAAIRDAFLDGSLDAPATCDRLMRAIDEVIRQALELVRRDLASAYPRKMAVLALGGYGRGAMFPFSDVDLQILSDKRERSQAEQMTERLLYILWDLGLKVGYATRSIDETLALVRDDVTVATAVLDARLLCGEEELFHQMERRLKAKYYDKQSSALIRALLEDKERRHERYGETIYLLEPNVKYGQGGLRDIQNAIWAAKVRYAIHAFPELVRLGIVRRRQLDDLLEARAFLWRVRHALQFLGGRKNDQLTFEYQERIARLFGFEDGESLGVERFMQSYYRHTKTIQTRSRLLVERCLTGSIGEKLRGSRRTIDENFRLYAGKLTVREADLFEHDPRQIVRIFRVSQREKRELYPHAKELIVRSLWRIDDAVRRDPETAQSFKELLCEVPDSEKSLMQMHELGVLSAYLPEFEAINGKTHHDVYHIYTVDVHTIYAVQRLKALASGELETRWPLATHLYRELTNVHPLYLALLLHDVGKGYGPGHSERGAKLVEPIAERLGLPPAEEETVRFLIRRHLLMAHTVEKHDLNDAGLVRRFAREVGDLTLLRQLYILTLCDMSTTGPQLSANWRDVMLQELYHKAADWLNEGLDLWNDPMKEVYRRKEEVINLTFPVHPGENYKAIGPIEEYFGLLPTRYFHATAASDIVRHMAMVKRLDSE